MKEEIEESFYHLQFNDVIDAQKTAADCLGLSGLFLKAKTKRPPTR